jgi:gamma-glutamyl hercynylcysteine S-oxide synthase
VNLHAKLILPLMLSFLCLLSWVTWAQHIVDFKIEELQVTSVFSSVGNIYTTQRPLVSYEINSKSYQAGESSPLVINFSFEKFNESGIKGVVVFKNTSKDTLSLSNVVPFGREGNEAYITGLGNHRLSRTHLFIALKTPVNVIVPDNAWELGYAGFPLDSSQKIFGFVRRDLTSMQKATRRRFETIIAPGGSVNYNFYSDFYQGNWQQGVREVFQKRYLYDVLTFDNTLFERADLKWIRNSYVMHLLMAWDKEYYDGKTGKFMLPEFIKKGKALYGGDDVVCIWPTWPTLGVDSRNQFDLYRDLPGGLPQLRALADSARLMGTKFFVAYNPWDESTRSEGHLQGLANLIKGTSADGVVLDTKGESSSELQEAADKVRAGVIMFSEGMAVPKDMQGIISGRVHNALYYPPLLNLNKFIRPDFAIFRVSEVFKEPIQREYAVAFFNGYGTEINQFAPGHPEWEDDQYRYLGKTSRILRENSTLFTADYSPLINTLRDSIWVNEWSSAQKTVYTILSFKPEGLHAPLFEVNDTTSHWIDLWKHEEIKTMVIDDKRYAIVNIDGFDTRYSGTNNEGDVSCVAQFRPTLDVKINGDKLYGTAQSASLVKIWKGNPSYEKAPIILNLQNPDFEVSITNALGRYEGKLVVQSFKQDEIVDECIIFLKPGTPRLISESISTIAVTNPTLQMVVIPAGKFNVKFTQGDEFIPYPKEHVGETIEMKSFAMDRYPVTNSEFEKFLIESNYQPSDTTRFLAHWVNGKIPKGQEKFPVTYISYEDAKSYAAWAGKRLPTELEWQYAAQTEKGNEWPWKQTKPVTRKETYVTETLTVKDIEGIDAKNCNLGDGKLYPVGKFKSGVNPYGLLDLVGCVWQLTNDEYENGSYRYIMMKGGSFFKPSSSWWYVQGGPRELHYRQFLLRVSQGFERNATVGFRCVQDLK